MTSGVLLMLIKYGVDALAVFLATDQLWSPVDYLVPSFFVRESKLQAFPGWLLVAMMLWTVPFLWIGVSMSLRRALNAGRSPWLALLFFVPFVNYLLMGVLSLLPTRRQVAFDAAPERAVGGGQLATVRALGAGVVVGVVLVAFCTLGLGGYGAALFLGIPFIMGTISAFVLNRDRPRTAIATQKVALLAVGLVGLGLLLFAVEGLVCVAMAVPLALPIAALGAIAGRVIARQAPGTALHALVAILAFPGLAAVESAPRPAPLWEVVSTIEVDAPAEIVWRHVVSFSELTEPPRWFFRLGIAYPVRATLEGRGVGAVRLCEFSTGAFVEPITAWEEPRRLAFDVTAQPPPLMELSPYRSVHPPHVDGYFRSRRGEFRLVPLPGQRTRLEGSTWYELDMAPPLYWRLWADAIIRVIHYRVLAHIKRLAEAR